MLECIVRWNNWASKDTIIKGLLFQIYIYIYIYISRAVYIGSRGSYLLLSFLCYIVLMECKKMAFVRGLIDIYDNN